jgi:hypothetical protein
MHSLRRWCVCCGLLAVVLSGTALHAQTVASNNGTHVAGKTPGCAGRDARACLALALEAMGGHDRLAAIKTVQMDSIGHAALMEQSYRQAPFITSYEREQELVDFAGQRVFVKQHGVWPESDLKGADSDSTLIVTPAGGVYRIDGHDYPCGGGDLDASREKLALGSERILLTAEAASDLRFLPPETLRSTPHTVLGFTWKGLPVRVALNEWNHLPDAVETTQEFRDFWFYWGDVEQRVYFDNWRLVNGVEVPSNEVVERNGAEWSSEQALDIVFDVAADEHQFAIDAKAAQQSLESKGWNRAFKGDHDQQLAPGIDLFAGSWNTTIVKQDDGVVILETPISGTFTQGILDEAEKRYPDVPVKAVVSTSDSWPHTGGVRLDVAKRLPVYILDLNEPLLDREVQAPHTIDPDLLAKGKRTPQWKIVAGKTEIGSGDNRMVLFPLRGALTERQYMVYFPERRLLYASDTLVLNADGTLYDPEMMQEVEAAVDREHLAVDTVFAMHQSPTPWSKVVALVSQAQKSSPS